MFNLDKNTFIVSKLFKLSGQHWPNRRPEECSEAAQRRQRHGAKVQWDGQHVLDPSPGKIIWFGSQTKVQHQYGKPYNIDAGLI